ncbi:MAG: hypothetical protein IKP72_11680 [Clostridia bacterium]|nr:hypothetical protein [Clostridia bacterium]
MEKKKVFVIMPFQDQFFEVYEMLKMQFQEGFEFSNANDEGNPQNILKDVVQPIYEADIILADLTGLNPNVMYELGLAHSFNKKTIIITQDDLSNLPFDLKQYRAKDYTTHFKKFAELVDFLKRMLEGAVDDSVSFGNPVKDFLSDKHINTVDWFNEKATIQLSSDEDKGFLDFLADIESDSEKLASGITEIGNDIKTMGIGVTKSSEEIDRVKKSGGSGTAAFIRKEAKKISQLVDSFSTKLRKHNTENFELWDKIEYNLLGLLENPIAANDTNKEGLIEYIKSLKSLKSSAAESRPGVVSFKNAMNEAMGLERSLNQSIRFVIQDLDTFIGFIDNLNISIEKIVAKSRFVIGEIS